MPDERIEAALAHWAPRFTSQGVDMNDFRAVTAGLEAWPEWLPAWVANGDVHAELAQDAEGRGRSLTAGQAWVRAALSYHFAKFVWMVDFDLYVDATRKAIDALYAAHRLLDPTAERVEAPLDGFTIAGNLRRPEGVEEPPLVLLLPGLDSTKEEFFNWENVFLERGMATFSLDGPGQGETGLHSSIYPNYEVAVTAALDALAGRDDVDLDRVGAAGVSLGGYYAPRAAAYEKRIKAAVGISGPFNFGACWDSMPGPTRDTVAHHTGSASQEEAREQAALLDLSEAVPLIDQPLLCITGRHDRLIPWQQTQRIADEAPNGEFVMWDEGNHVCNNIPYKYRPLTADWLREHLA
ncbi:MAG TPA: alpha/beta fold hydrolase [Gaiellaceae bacterium]|nr:alpha/beta fold hydrolase [Gaiellaceae bacterium]